MWSDPEVQTVAPGVHRTPIPLPSDGLRAVNVYVVEDGDGVTLIDAGWDGPAAREALQRGLDVAGAGIGDIRRMLITHMHYDHLGQATALRRAGAGSYWLGEAEEANIRSLVEDPEAARADRLAQLAAHGAVEVAERARRRAPSAAERPDLELPDRWLADQEEAPLAGGTLRVIATPGHTRGHLCFAHEGRRLLFSGDHVLPHITPSIGLESLTNRMALADFLASLGRVRSMDVDLVLPAHGEVFADLAGRVDELTAHHDARLSACVAAVGGDGSHAYAVAQRLPWTRRETDFADLDRFNQVVAIWETAAHLELLAARGELRRVVEEGTITFHHRSPATVIGPRPRTAGDRS